eukprot:54426-Chlamydomonas_euryale.AAC.2
MPLMHTYNVCFEIWKEAAWLGHPAACLASLLKCPLPVLSSCSPAWPIRSSCSPAWPIRSSCSPAWPIPSSCSTAWPVLSSCSPAWPVPSSCGPLVRSPCSAALFGVLSCRCAAISAYGLLPQNTLHTCQKTTQSVQSTPAALYTASLTLTPYLHSAPTPAAAAEPP